MSDEIEDHEHGYHEDGRPTLCTLSAAIQCWSGLQGVRPVTVGEAATTFNLTPARIVEAVEWHPWMFLAGEGPAVDQIIEHEGE